MGRTSSSRCTSETWPESVEYLTAHADELLTGDAAELLADIVGNQPDLLRYLGLLELASLIGVEQAHSLITDPDAEPPTSADTLLSLARLAAGLHDDSADAQFTHAVTALHAGLTDEAAWAMQRCRDASASWERPAFLRRLDDLAPDLDVTPLITALNSSTPTQDPADD
jgi:hypothetical protein